jgi:hypothetical protein
VRVVHIPVSGAVKAAESLIPNPRTAGDAMAVTDGTVTAGYVIERDHSHFSFDADGILLGEYSSRRLAMRSIPTLKQRRA